MATVSDFLLERFENSGLKHIFGVSGYYIIDFLNKISSRKKLSLVNNTCESHSGFAADGYARIHGMGCVCVDYNVGALKVCNAIAGAYAEKSPVIVVSGSPGMKERDENYALHQFVRSFDCQKNIFENITCLSIVLDNPSIAGYEIDRAFEALKHHKQPIYIELPRDIADKPIDYNVYRLGTPKSPETDVENLEDALKEVSNWIDSSKNPIILAGVEVARFGLGVDLVKFAEKNNIPIATTMLSKSVMSELHSLHLGVYAGLSSYGDVQKRVEESDCLLILGEKLTDFTLGFSPSKFKNRQTVSCSADGLRVKNHTYPNVVFKDFCNSLFKLQLNKRSLPIIVKREVGEFVSNGKVKITTVRFFEKLNSFLKDNMALIADTGDSLFGSVDLTTAHQPYSFLGQAFYGSMGFSIPAALGLQLAKPNVRPIVLVGDGSFQMCCSELSTIAEYKFNPILFVLNNNGYITERCLKEGKFTQIRNWKYENFTSLIEYGDSYKVETEEDLEIAMEKSLKSKELSVINVILSPNDMSPALKRLKESCFLN